jgi:endonuclease/exonuclease/phosphatase family metal-dependent hydrolase
MNAKTFWQSTIQSFELQGSEKYFRTHTFDPSRNKSNIMKPVSYLLFICILISLSFPASAQSLKVMSYNIRYATESDGINAWSKRKDRVYALLQKYDPDIIGIQEGLALQLDDIIRAMPEYGYVGVGREDGKKAGEFSAILYKKDKYQVVDQSTFWLSEQPDQAGSKSWDAALTRVATWARFKEIKSGKLFFVLNTHFDHVGKDARLQSARLIKEKLPTLAADLPVIVTGDFNHQRNDPPYPVMVRKDKLQLMDPAPDNAPGTFCSFAVDSIPCVGIDYIYHSAHWNSSNYAVIQDHDGSNYPSDHLPVMVEMSLRK